MSNFESNFSDKLTNLNYSLLSEVEKNNVINYFSIRLGVNKESINETRFYELLEQNLSNTCNIIDESDLSSMLESIGMEKLSYNQEIILIWKMPDQLVKIKFYELLKHWDEIWCPPADDAIVLRIPNVNTALITHWGTIMYD